MRRFIWMISKENLGLKFGRCDWKRASLKKPLPTGADSTEPISEQLKEEREIFP